jgi:hypothetical protein
MQLPTASHRIEFSWIAGMILLKLLHYFLSSLKMKAQTMLAGMDSSFFFLNSFVLGAGFTDIERNL